MEMNSVIPLSTSISFRTKSQRQEPVMPKAFFIKSLMFKFT